MKEITTHETCQDCGKKEAVSIILIENIHSFAWVYFFNTEELFIGDNFERKLLCNSCLRKEVLILLLKGFYIPKTDIEKLRMV